MFVPILSGRMRPRFLVSNASQQSRRIGLLLLANQKRALSIRLDTAQSLYGLEGLLDWAGPEKLNSGDEPAAKPCVNDNCHTTIGAAEYNLGAQPQSYGDELGH